MTDRDPDDPIGRGRSSRYDDARDDYDDEFAVRRTPVEVARRKVLVPAIAFVAIGVLGICGTGVGALVLTLEVLSGRWPPFFGDIVGLFALLLGAGLLGIVIAGGVCLRRLRGRGLALTAAYIVTGLSLAGCYGILFYPFGIWALVLLYQPDVVTQFRRPPDDLRDRDA